MRLFVQLNRGNDIIYKNLNDYEILYMISENNEDAYNLMIDKYRPLIIKYADYYLRNYPNQGLEKEELIQEGRIGLINAISNYINQDNCIFYTFASLIIKREMARYVKGCLTNKNLILTNSTSLNEVIVKDDLILADTLTRNSDCVEYIQDDKYYSNILYNFKYELSDIQSQVYELRLNNFSNKEISILLDISYKSVDNCIRMMKQKFKKYIQIYL